MQQGIRTILASTLIMASNAAWAVSEEGAVADAGLGTDINGDVVAPEELRGQVVLATYWVSWCGYCRQAMADFAAFQQAAKAHGLKVVFINHKEDRQIFRDAARNLRKYEVLMAHDKKGSYGDAYGVESYPHILLLGKNGTIVRSSSGYGVNSKNFYAQAIAELLQPATVKAADEAPPEAAPVRSPVKQSGDSAEIDRSTRLEAPELESQMDLTMPMPTP